MNYFAYNLSLYGIWTVVFFKIVEKKWYEKLENTESHLY